MDADSMQTLCPPSIRAGALGSAIGRISLMDLRRITDQENSVALTAERPDAAEIREHLKHVLRSPMFRGSLRSRKFIKYIVESALDGQSERLKERTLGIEVFGREASYNTGEDAVVRVTAGEVRKRLREYYASNTDSSAVRIDLPSGSYVPEFRLAKAEVIIKGTGASVPTRGMRWPWVGTAWKVLLACCLLATGWFAGTFRFKHSPAPYGGTPWPLPGTVQAEDFDIGGQSVAYYTKYNTNLGGVYRPSEGVSMEASTDAGGGYDVAWTTGGEWLNFTVKVSASGSYIIQTRVSCNCSGAVFHYDVDGAPATPEITVPDTGGWQVWTTVSSPINLTAGKHIIRLTMDTASPTGAAGNFNWFSVEPAHTPASRKVAPSGFSASSAG
jgi:hypothetical protein